MKHIEEGSTCKCCNEIISYDNTITEAGIAEYGISGLCEKCFDDIAFDMFDMQDNTHVLDKEVICAVKDGVVLAGGSLRSLVDDNEEIMDYDLFFTKDKVEETKHYFINAGYNNTFTCPKGDLYTYVKDDTKVQLINKRIYTDCNDLINSFDITACCCAYDGNTFYKNDRFVFDVLNKQIHINKIEYPLATMKRIAKYVKKGYYLTNTAAEKFLYNTNQMQLTDDNMQLYID